MRKLACLVVGVGFCGLSRQRAPHQAMLRCGTAIFCEVWSRHWPGPHNYVPLEVTRASLLRRSGLTASQSSGHARQHGLRSSSHLLFWSIAQSRALCHHQPLPSCLSQPKTTSIRKRFLQCINTLNHHTHFLRPGTANPTTAIMVRIQCH